MYKIGFNGKKLLEAICFEGVKETIEPQSIEFGKFYEENPAGLVDLAVLINNIAEDVKEEGDSSVPIAGYDLCRALVGNKNAFYIGAVIEPDEYGFKTFKLAAKGNKYSINKFEKAIKNYDFCVSCNAITPYRKSTPIDQRKGYVEGAGQLCDPCYTKTYGKK